MAASIRGVRSFTAAGALAQNAGTVPGDVQLFFASVDGGAATCTITGGAAWSQITGSPARITNGDQQSVFIYRQVCGASEPASYTVAASSNVSGFLLTISGADTSAFIDAALITNANATTTPTDTRPVSPIAMTANAITTGAADELLVYYGTVDWSTTATTTFTAPSGWTLQGSVSPASYTNGMLATMTQAVAGTTGAVAGTATQGTARANYASALIAIKSAAPAGVELVPTPVTVPANFLGMHFHYWPQARPGNTVTTEPAYTYGVVRNLDYAPLSGSITSLIWSALNPTSVTTVADMYASAPSAWAAFDTYCAAHKAKGAKLYWQMYGTPAHAAGAQYQVADAYGIAAGAAPPDATKLALFLDALFQRAAANAIEISDIECWNEPGSALVTGVTLSAVDATANTVSFSGWLGANRRCVFVTNGTAPGGLTNGAAYWTLAGSSPTSLSLTQGGAAIDITSIGTGTHQLHPINTQTADSDGSTAVTAVNATADTITFAPWRSAGVRVFVTSTGTLPGGITANQLYYTLDDGTTTRLSLTQGGAAIDITSAGSGTMAIHMPTSWTGSWVELAAVQKIVYQKAKSYNAACNVWSPSFWNASSAAHYLESSDGSGGYAYQWCDGVAYHPYSSTLGTAYEGANHDAILDIRAMRAMFTLAGRTMKLCASEWGFEPWNANALTYYLNKTDAEQADILKQLLTVHAALGVQRSIPYTADEGTSQAGLDGYIGTLGIAESAPKIAAMQWFQANVAGRTITSALYDAATGTVTSLTTVSTAPTITAVSAAQLGAAITITGTNLTDATVTADGQAQTITSNTGTQITIAALYGGSALAHVPGTANVTLSVTTPNGTATASITIAVPTGYNAPVQATSIAASGVPAMLSGSAEVGDWGIAKGFEFLPDYTLRGTTSGELMIFKTGEGLGASIAIGLNGASAALQSAVLVAATAHGQLTTQIRLNAQSFSLAGAGATLTASLGISASALAQAQAGGVLLTSIKLSEAAAATAGASGTITTAIPITAAAIAQAQASGTLTVQIRLAGTAQSAATAAGTLGAPGAALAGSAVATPFAGATLTAAIHLDAEALGQASAHGGLLTAIMLMGSAAVSPAAAAGLSARVTLGGIALARATATADATTQIPLAGAAISVSAAGGDITANIRLSGAALAAALASATMGSGVSLHGSAVAGAQAGASLITSILLEGFAGDQAGARGELITRIALSTQSIAQAAAEGSLVVPIPLAGQAIARAAASGAVTTGIALVGIATGQSDSRGLLVSGVSMGATAAALASASNSLSAQIRLDGHAMDVAAAAGTMDATILLTGQALTLARSGGAIRTAIALQTDTGSDAAAVGMLSTRIDMTATAAALASGGGAPWPEILLSGSAEASTASTGLLTTRSRVQAATIGGKAWRSIDIATATARVREWLVGQSASLSASVSAADGGSIDPEHLRFIVCRPDGSIDRYDYGASGEIVRDDTGLYHLDILLDKPGRWYWRVETSIPQPGAAEGMINVGRSRFTEAP